MAHTSFDSDVQGPPFSESYLGSPRRHPLPGQRWEWGTPEAHKRNRIVHPHKDHRAVASLRTWNTCYQPCSPPMMTLLAAIRKDSNSPQVLRFDHIPKRNTCGELEGPRRWAYTGGGRMPDSRH